MMQGACTKVNSIIIRSIFYSFSWILCYSNSIHLHLEKLNSDYVHFEISLASLQLQFVIFSLFVLSSIVFVELSSSFKKRIFSAFPRRSLGVQLKNEQMIAYVQVRYFMFTVGVEQYGINTIAIARSFARYKLFNVISDSSDFIKKLYLTAFVDYVYSL